MSLPPPSSSSLPSLFNLDLYSVLDPSHALSASSSLITISSHYRKRARVLHPDKNPDNPHAAELFDQLQQAYELLCDEAKKKEYDKHREGVASRKRKIDAEQQQVREMKQKLKEREAAAAQQQQQQHPHNRHKQQIHRERVDRENQQIIQQMREQILKRKQTETQREARGAQSEDESASATVVVAPLAASLSPLSLSVLDVTFSVYGKIENILMKKHRAFITYYHSQDADRAVAGNNHPQQEQRWKVERMPLSSVPNSDKQSSLSPFPSVSPSVVPVASSLSISDYESDTLARMVEEAVKKKKQKQAADEQTRQ